MADAPECCAVCLEDNDESSWDFPGCRHRFHARCVLQLAQYDARCPVCRHRPEDVQPRSDTFTVVRVRMTQARDEWRRYAARRRRLINGNSPMRQKFEALRELRTTIASRMHTLQTTYDRQCRVVWRDDPQIREQRRDLTRLRRRELRLERVLSNFFDARLGPEP